MSESRNGRTEPGGNGESPAESIDSVWEVPDPLSLCEVRHEDGSLTVVRRHGNPAGPRLLLTHGNGLAIDFYYPFWSLLADDFDLVLYDLRNHGWNEVGAQNEHNFFNLVRDQERVVEAVAAHYGKKPTIGVFHSISALATLVSPSLGSRATHELSACILFDPPVHKPGGGDKEFDEATELAARMVRRRSERFHMREDFTEVLKYMPLLIRAVPGAGELMAKTVLRKSADGRWWELRCPREYEAQIAQYVRTYSCLVDFAGVGCPTKVIGADPMVPYSYLPTLDLSHVVAIEYDFIPETTHFLQVEKPEECVVGVCDFLRKCALL